MDRFWAAAWRALRREARRSFTSTYATAQRRSGSVMPLHDAMASADLRMTPAGPETRHRETCRG